MALNKSRSTRPVLLLCASAMMASGFLTTASAQSSEEAVKFDLPAQSLEQALKSFSVSADKQLMFATDLAEGKTVAGLSGEMEPMQALDVLLDGTGLVYETTSSNVILVKVADADQGGDSDSKNLTLQPALMAQTQTSQAQTAAGSQSDGGGAGAVTGKVTDVRTGATLKGAKVTIDETGQWTGTNDLGEFRFPSVPSGVVTLTVSYLGYAGQSTSIDVRSDGVVQNFALRSGSELDEIIVFGQRSARAAALNLERTAPNSTTVLSADIIGQFNGTTISEALRRAPGVAFVPDEITGDGTQVIVRGLEPDLNQVTLNGVRLLDGTGLGRAPDLSGVLTESIERVTINKTLLPSQDSSGVGGLVEIETKGPLDRPKQFLSANVQYGFNDEDFGDETLIAGTASRRFGSAESFGVSASVSYREREVSNASYGFGAFDFGTYLPAGVDNLNDIDPRTPFPFDGGDSSIFPKTSSVNFFDTEDETLQLSLTLQKKLGDHTELRLDIDRNERDVSSYTSTTAFRTSTGYVSLPVDTLGGEERFALVAEDTFRNDPTLEFLFGEGIRGEASRSISYVPSRESSTMNYSFRGVTELDQWEFGYGTSFQRSKVDSSPAYSLRFGAQASGSTGLFGLSTIDPSFVSEDAPRASDGSLISLFGALPEGGSGAFLLPLLSDVGFAFINDVDDVPINFYTRSNVGQSDVESRNFNSRIRRHFSGGLIDYVEVGTSYDQVDFFFPGESSALDRLNLGVADGVMLSDLGLQLEDGLFASAGTNDDLSVFSRNSVVNLVRQTDQFVADGLLVDLGTSLGDTEDERFTEETTVVGYLESRASWGRLEVTGGFRFEEITVGSRFFAEPVVRDVNGTTIDLGEGAGEFVSDEVSQTNVLPRLVANFRWTDDLIIRAGYFKTISRPRLANLTQRSQFTLSLDTSSSSTGDRPTLFVEQGNPDLKPVETNNFDASIEWYTDDVGVLKASVFYKAIENTLDSVRAIGGIDELPSETVLPSVILENYDVFADPIELQITKPINSDTNAEIWGLELAVERQLAFLPGIWGGLGIYVNYTYTDSQEDKRFTVPVSIDPRGFVVLQDVPFNGDPKHSGTAGITYNNGPLQGSLLYTVQDRRLSNLGRFGVNSYFEAVDTLDARVDYAWEINDRIINVFVRGNDLLKSAEDASAERSIGGDGSIPTYRTGGSFLGGRTILLGVSATF